MQKTEKPHGYHKADSWQGCRVQKVGSPWQLVIAVRYFMVTRPYFTVTCSPLPECRTFCHAVNIRV